MRTYYLRSCNGEDLTTREWHNLIIPSHSDNKDDSAAIAGKAAELVLAHRVAVFPGALDGRLSDSFRDCKLGTKPRP